MLLIPCAGPVPKDFLKSINQVNSNLQDVIKSLQETLSLKTDENNSFLEQTRDLKHQITVLKHKIKDTEHHASVTTQLDEHEVSHISPRVLPRTPRKVSEKDFLKSIVTILETKLVNVEERLKQSITNELEKSKRTIDNKLDNIMQDNKSVKGSVSVKENVPRASEVNDFKSILVEARNDQLLEEKEMEKRSFNLIIHGLKENGNDANEINKNDEAMVDLFFEKINVEVRPTKFYLLGKPDPNKIRPLKLEMVNSTDRDAVMKKLKLLKGTEEELGKLSVREDYTKNEREQIKKLVDVAKDKNAEDSTHHWVVRGTPKN